MGEALRPVHGMRRGLVKVGVGSGGQGLKGNFEGWPVEDHVQVGYLSQKSSKW